MAGIEKRYRITNKELFDNWYAEIEDWGSVKLLVIYLPRGNRYCDGWFKTIQGAKRSFTLEMEQKGAKWEEYKS